MSTMTEPNLKTENDNTDDPKSYGFLPQPIGSYQYVDVNGFTPNSGEGWINVGSIDSYEQNGNEVSFTVSNSLEQNRPGPIIYFLSDTLYRVRFHPLPEYDYQATVANSFAVIKSSRAPVTVTVKDLGDSYSLSTGNLELIIQKSEFLITTYYRSKKINQDAPAQGIMYLNNKQQLAVANMKVYPPGANYFGFGEKAGLNLNKSNTSLTFFAYDNFEYTNQPTSHGNGPFCASIPLYNSTPVLIEANPTQGYFYGLLFDNPAQSYFNLGNNSHNNNGDMFGKYYFGALYGELNYYLYVGDTLPDVLTEYTELTGRTPLVPKYALGYQQGCYGYYDRWKLEQIAQLYRVNNFPIDGLHIDVDFQNDYRTFTNSDQKFPDVSTMFSNLTKWGFHCSTNITALITSNPLDETAPLQPDGYIDEDALDDYKVVEYPARETGLQQDVFLKNQFANNNGNQYAPLGDASLHFVGGENYGDNDGYNPYAYPPLSRSRYDVETLSSSGYYPDFGKKGVQDWWGQQYEYLINAGLAFVWQDMMVPALAVASTYSSTDLNIDYSLSGEELATQVHNYQRQLGQSVTFEQNGKSVTQPPTTFETYSDSNTNNVNNTDARSLPLALMMTAFGKQVPNAYIHNAYGLLEAQGTYKGLSQIHLNNFNKKQGSNANLPAPKRPFIIARGGYAGVHRLCGTMDR